MKLTKLVHACLLIETDGDVTIFDPGDMSYGAGLLDISAMPRLDRIVITHAHVDHFSEVFIGELVAKFPSVRIITTPELVTKLLEMGITAQSTGDETIELFEAPHESMQPLSPLPMVQNVGAHYKGLLTHPGDSHHFPESKGILALPVDGPWGSTIAAIRLAVELKPKIVLPIHDWMWTDTWKNEYYVRLEGYFKSIGIIFIKLVDGQVIEL